MRWIFSRQIIDFFERREFEPNQGLAQRLLDSLVV